MEGELEAGYRRGRPEADLQRAVVQALRVVLPRTAIIHHSANEVTEPGRSGRVRQAILTGMGVHPGFADLEVFCEGRVLFLELKAPKGQLRPAHPPLAGRAGAVRGGDPRAVAVASRQAHPAPPDGPKALDRAMERAARGKQEAQSARGGAGAGTPGARAPLRRQPAPAPSQDAQAAFYADWVNSGRYLPSGAISPAIRAAMLARGLVTAEHLAQRGVRP